MSAEGWDEVVAINLCGLFYCCHAVLPAMRAQKDGLIINISSWAGRYASTLTGPAYNATKRAVIALTESINAEECMHGIRATSVLPGEVATPIMEKRPVPPAKEDRERMLQAEDLGQTILYLASLPPRACVNEAHHQPDLEPLLRRWPGEGQGLGSISLLLPENQAAACSPPPAAPAAPSARPRRRGGSPACWRRRSVCIFSKSPGFW